MAKSIVRFNCGCGFKTDNYLEAALHCDSTGHTLEVLGTVQPDKKPERRGLEAQHDVLFGANPIKL